MSLNSWKASTLGSRVACETIRELNTKWTLTHSEKKKTRVINVFAVSKRDTRLTIWLTWPVPDFAPFAFQGSLQRGDLLQTVHFFVHVCCISFTIKSWCDQDFSGWNCIPVLASSGAWGFDVGFLNRESIPKLALTMFSLGYSPIHQNHTLW